jgi:hypothetical protein
MVLSIIDNEQIRVRNLQNQAVLPQTALPLPGIASPTSTLAPVTPQTKPELAKPRHINLAIIDCFRDTEKLDAKAVRNFEQNVKRYQADIETLEQEKIEELKKESNAAKNRNSWNVLSTMANYVSNASAIVLGLSCGSTPAGHLLIAAGATGFFNQGMRELNGWDWVVSFFSQSTETQRKYSSIIETSNQFLSLGLGLVGVGQAYSNGLFNALRQGANAQSATAKIGQTLGIAGTAVAVGSRVGTAFYDKRLAHTQARMREISTDLTVSQQSISQETAAVIKMIESGQMEANEVRKGISSLQISQDL